MLNTTVERVHIFLQHFTSYYRKFQLRSILQIFNLLIGNTKGKCQFSKTQNLSSRTTHLKTLN
jgi:hypothetical protein